MAVIDIGGMVPLRGSQKSARVPDLGLELSRISEKACVPSCLSRDLDSLAVLTLPGPPSFQLASSFRPASSQASSKDEDSSVGRKGASDSYGRRGHWILGICAC